MKYEQSCEKWYGTLAQEQRVNIYIDSEYDNRKNWRRLNQTGKFSKIARAEFVVRGSPYEAF